MLRTILVPILVLAAALPAAAQQPTKPATPPKWEAPWYSCEFRLGFFLSTYDTGLEVSSEVGLGATIDLEDVLDMDESTIAYRVEASIPLGRRHRLHLDAFSVTRKGERTLSQDLTIGNTTFPAGTGLESESDFQLYNLVYGYSIMQDDRLDLSITFGIHAIRSSVDMDAAVLNRSETANLFLPIPLPGMRLDLALTQSLFLRQRAEFLWIGVGDYSGIMSDLSLRLEYLVTDHFSLGIGFNSLNVRLQADDDDNAGVNFKGTFELGFSGLLLYAGTNF